MANGPNSCSCGYPRWSLTVIAVVAALVSAYAAFVSIPEQLEPQIYASMQIQKNPANGESPLIIRLMNAGPAGSVVVTSITTSIPELAVSKANPIHRLLISPGQKTPVPDVLTPQIIGPGMILQSQHEDVDSGKIEQFCDREHPSVTATVTLVFQGEKNKSLELTLKRRGKADFWESAYQRL